MNKNQPNNLHLLYIDILRGYTLFNNSKYNNIYFKHFTSFDLGDIEEKQQFYYNKSVTNGLPTLQEQEKYLIKEGLWSKENDSLILEYQSYIDNLKVTKSKLFRQAEIQDINHRISEYVQKLSDLRTEKQKLLGYTAEMFVNKKITEYHIYNCIFKDSSLRERFFNPEIFEELNDDEILELTNIYNSITENYNEANLKKLALSPFFFNFFCLSESAYEFYGKPIVELTFYQTEIYNHGKTFKHILSSCKEKPSDELMRDPDKLIEWHEGKQNMQEAVTKAGSVSSIVGLTKEDRKNLGINNNDDNPNNKLVEAAKAKGGELGFGDIMKIINK